MPEAAVESHDEVVSDTEVDNTPEPGGGDTTDDGWGSARAEFFKDGELDAQDVDDDSSDSEQTGEKAEDEVDSHLEADRIKAEDEVDETVGKLDVKYTLDDTKIPHKYRPFVKEKIDAILADANKLSDQHSHGYQESANVLAKAFVDVLSSDNPLKTLHGYAEKVVPAFGLPDELVSKIAGKLPQNEQNQENENKPQFDLNVVQQRVNEEKLKIEDKYWPQLENAEGPEARKLFFQMEREKNAIDQKVNLTLMQAILGAYHAKMVKPRFDEVGEIKRRADYEKAEAVRSSQVSRWDSADQKMTAKYKDWPTYKAKVKEILLSDYDAQKKYVNQTGKGHEKMLNDLYLVVSRRAHIDALKKPKFGSPGVKPVGKHINTQKAGGSGWNDIKSRFWSDVIPAE